MPTPTPTVNRCACYFGDGLVRRCSLHENAEQMRDALLAIKARITGVWDMPTLVKYGALGTKDEDILHIVNITLATLFVEGRQP